MNVNEEHIVVSDDNGEYVSVVPGYLLDMESEGTTGEETESEEIEELVSSESDVESESESESGVGEDNSVDYSSILLSIDGRLENLETYLSDFEDFKSNTLSYQESTSATQVETRNYSEGIITILVGASIFVLIVVVYNWLNNFIK